MPSRMDEPLIIMVCKSSFLVLNTNETASSDVFGAYNWFKGIFRRAKAGMHGSHHATHNAGSTFFTVRP
jgi:hypothetical protein